MVKTKNEFSRQVSTTFLRPFNDRFLSCKLKVKCLHKSDSLSGGVLLQSPIEILLFKDFANIFLNFLSDFEKILCLKGSDFGKVFCFFNHVDDIISDKIREVTRFFFYFIFQQIINSN